MQVELYKKKGTYQKDGEERNFTNFYIQCGDSLVPIEVKNFSTKEKQDFMYSSRRVLLGSYAALLPEKE